MGQRASTSTATEVLGGLVERVTFHNEENGFCVLRVKARGQRDLITVLGHMRAARTIAGWAEQKVIREIMLFCTATVSAPRGRCGSTRPMAPTPFS